MIDSAVELILDDSRHVARVYCSYEVNCSTPHKIMQNTTETEGGPMRTNRQDAQHPVSSVAGPQVAFIERRLTTTPPIATYRFTKGVDRWKIALLESNSPTGWKLHRAVNEVWSPLEVYPTPEAAMEAVGSGRTGIVAWDSAPHIPADFEKEQWSLERW